MAQSLCPIDSLPFDKSLFIITPGRAECGALSAQPRYGTHITETGIYFSLVAPNCLFVELGLFNHDGSELLYSIKLQAPHHKSGHVWHVHIDHLMPPVVYAWKVTYNSSQDDEVKTSEWLLDPFACDVIAHPCWGKPVKGQQARHKAVVLARQEFDWEADQPINRPKEQMVIYEMHVRSFTCNPNSKVSAPGSFLGIIDKIPHLLDLGVNTVELMPVFTFDELENPFRSPFDGFALRNVWGYATLNFFSPMRRFAHSTHHGAALTEFRQMVKALHKAGIEVLLDVVYNHTGHEASVKEPHALSILDEPNYYLHNEHGQSFDASGCGNSLSCNYPFINDLIISSLRYWVDQMHVDGFRFDLASSFYRDEQARFTQNPPLVQTISCDPLLAEVKLIAEPWDAAGFYQVGSYGSENKRWSEWNGKYRDAVRKFISRGEGGKGEFATRLSGSQDLYGEKRTPNASLNFITAHDGFTLADLVSYNDKHNEANGEENRDGTNDNNSWNCGVEGVTDDEAVLRLRQQQMRNFHLALMVSQGVPMLLMGDEYGHSRRGNNNSWGQDNDLNWFDWAALEKNQDFYRFYKGLIHFRKAHSHLFQRNAFLTQKDVCWHGLEPQQPHWQSKEPLLGFTLFERHSGGHLFIFFNCQADEVEVTLPELKEAGCPLRSWHRIVDTGLPPSIAFTSEENAIPLTTSHYSLSGHSALLCKAMPPHKIYLGHTQH